MIDPLHIVAGALTGFIVGLTGVGGGALMTPILLLFFGVTPTTAIATDLWFAAITKIAGTRIHHAAGNVDWQVARYLWMGSLPSATIVVVLVAIGHTVGRVEWLTTAIGSIIVITSIGLLLSPKMLLIARARTIDARQSDKINATQATKTVFSGAVLGVCVALTSVGAGALGSVVLLYLYPTRMVPHRLVATDIAHAIPLAIIAGMGYLFAGKVDWMMLLGLLTGSVPAVIIGGLVVRKMSGQWLLWILATVLMIAGIKVLM